MGQRKHLESSTGFDPMTSRTSGGRSIHWATLSTLLVIALCRTLPKYEPSIWPCSPRVSPFFISQYSFLCLFSFCPPNLLSNKRVRFFRRNKSRFSSKELVQKSHFRLDARTYCSMSFLGSGCGGVFKGVPIHFVHD